MTRSSEMLWTVALTWLVACASHPARAEETARAVPVMTRGPQESLEDFAARNGPSGATLETLRMGTRGWGGRGAVVAFYRLGSDDEEVGAELEHVSAYVFVPSGRPSRYTRGLIGTCGWEGGPPTVKAAFLAASGPLRRTSLFVICAWELRHHDVFGTLYATYVYDAPARDASGGVVVTGGESEPLSGGCDCTWTNGRTRKAKYTTEGAVRAALRRQR